MPPTVALLIDYQNIHLTARDTFAPPGTTAHATLLEPGLFADQVIQHRASRQGDANQAAAVLERVLVYRGMPSNVHDPRLYAASQAQRAQWTRDRRVEVYYRPLRYPGNWPKDPAREKGIDVLLAINLVRLADDPGVDVVILATHDTDLEPALEMAAGNGKAKIETAGWAGRKRLRVQGRSLWHTALEGAHFVQARDRRDYWSP